MNKQLRNLFIKQYSKKKSNINKYCHCSNCINLSDARELELQLLECKKLIETLWQSVFQSYSRDLFKYQSNLESLHITIPWYALIMET